MTEQEAWKAKQEWLERIMASSLNPRIKTFAYCIYKRMYGARITSYPQTKHIMEDGGFSSSGHFTEYRQALMDCGAITGDLDYHTASATNKNYEYALNLDWDGAVAPKGTAVAPTDKSDSTSGKCHGTTGASNTTNNTTTNTANKTSTNAPVVAHAPTVTFNKLRLDGAFIYTIKDVATSSNKESTGSVYLVNHDGVTKSPAVAPVEVQQEDNELPPTLEVRKMTLEQRMEAVAAARSVVDW